MAAVAVLASEYFHWRPTRRAGVLWAGDDRGCIQAFTMQPATGVLGRQVRRLTVHEGALITSLSARTWLSREAADPCLLANVGGISALMLFRLLLYSSCCYYLLVRYVKVHNRTCFGVHCVMSYFF